MSGHSLSSKAGKEVTRLNEVMKTLFPQILHFLETGFVANKKIIHLQMDKLYAIVRGKAGKNVEFGLKWGLNRIAGGFIQGYLMKDQAHLSDKKFAIEAIKKHEETFGIIPETFGYDCGVYSEVNIKKVKKMGVKNIGIAPKGQNEWDITDEELLDHVKRERAQVEGCIGTIKCKKYGFNKPNAKSISAMMSYGHRAILGFNLNKMIKIAAEG